MARDLENMCYYVILIIRDKSLSLAQATLTGPCHARARCDAHAVCPVGRARRSVLVLHSGHQGFSVTERIPVKDRDRRAASVRKALAHPPRSDLAEPCGSIHTQRRRVASLPLRTYLGHAATEAEIIAAQRTR